MNRYIHQLIEDLNQAIAISPEIEILNNNLEFESDEDEVISDAFFEHYITGKEIELGEIVGIDQILLPPIEKLTALQAAKVFPYLESLLSAYGFELDFPKNVPDSLKYELVRQVWNDKYLPANMGAQVIEFCDYDCDFCPFGSELCQCKQFEKMCI